MFVQGERTLGSRQDTRVSLWKTNTHTCMKWFQFSNLFHHIVCFQCHVLLSAYIISLDFYADMSVCPKGKGDHAHLTLEDKHSYANLLVELSSSFC